MAADFLMYIFLYRKLEFFRIQKSLKAILTSFFFNHEKILGASHAFKELKKKNS